jgi:hypothetical protein
MFDRCKVAIPIIQPTNDPPITSSIMRGAWLKSKQPTMKEERKFTLDDCSQHKKEVAGISDMRQLAIMVADLHYESLEQFLKALASKISLDALSDSKKGRNQLAIVLETAAQDILSGAYGIEAAYEISKPFMNK